MSSYIAQAEHPLTKKTENAFFMDDFFGPHAYAVVFRDGHVFEEGKVKHEASPDIEDSSGRVLDWNQYPEKLYIDSKEYKHQYPFIGK